MSVDQKLIKAKREQLRAASQIYPKAKAIFDVFHVSELGKQLEIIEKYGLRGRMLAESWEALTLEDDITLSAQQHGILVPYDWEAKYTTLKAKYDAENKRIQECNAGVQRVQRRIL